MYILNNKGQEKHMMTAILIGLGTLCVYFFTAHVVKLVVFLATSGIVGVVIAAVLAIWLFTDIGLVGSTWLLLGGMVLFGHLIGAHNTG